MTLINTGTIPPPPPTVVTINNSNSYTFSNLAGSDYIISIEDQTCGQSDFEPGINVGGGDEIVISPISNIELDCFGDNDGFIDIAVSGGSPGYTYLWSTGATSQDVNNLSAGNYVVIITDDNGCSDNFDFDIIEPNDLELSLDASFTDLVCFGDDNGSLNISVNGGTLPYSYLWTASNGGDVTGQENNQNLTNLVVGDYDLVVIDANKGFTKQDKAIADDVINKGKGMAILVNKWDLIEKETNTMRDFALEMSLQFKSLSHYPALFISAKTKQRISDILKTANKIYDLRLTSIGTSDLNKFLQKVLKLQSPPALKGKAISLKYMTQVSSAPHLFVIFTNYPKLIQPSYKRFIENQLRESFNLEGVPIRISFRKK